MRNKLEEHHINVLIGLYEKHGGVITDVASEFLQIFDGFSGEGVVGFENFRKRLTPFFRKRGLLSPDKVALEETEEFKKASGRKLGSSRYYLFTWQQNKTPIHRGAYRKLLMYKDFLGAELSVILGRYQNPTSVFRDLQCETWDAESSEYWDANTHDITRRLRVLSGVKIVPTAKYPLRGLQDLTSDRCVILGHPKMHMQALPVLQSHEYKRYMFTTGAISVANYTDSGRGAISKGYHKLGFTIVEMFEDDSFVVRQVEMEANGDFIDYCHKVTDAGVDVVRGALGLVCGDTHVLHLDENIDKMNTRICEDLNIKNLVLHDVADGESASHWINADPIASAIRHQRGNSDIIKELDGVVEFVSTKKKYGPVVVKSNHNDRFDIILKTDWRKDVANAPFYLDYTLKSINGDVGNIGVLGYYLKSKLDWCKVLGWTDSFMLGKYECGQHGDYGVNGAKGSQVSFRNVGVPMILAHTHAPFRADDTFYAGTNTEDNLGYNQKGMTTSGQANVLVTENGMAQILLFMGKGRDFTTFRPQNNKSVAI